MAMVVGVFENLVNAEDAVADLVASGYSRNEIRVLVRDGVPHPGRRCADTPDAANEEGLKTLLEAAGLQVSAAHFFADAICNGAVLVAVLCASPRAYDARDILDVYNDSAGGSPAAQRRTLM